MNYVGGKWRQGPAIACMVADLHRTGAPYFEPFCGALGSACRTVPVAAAARSTAFLSDRSEPVITMWRAVFDGWDPPHVVPEEVYRRVKEKRDPRDPLTAFCGFGLSFGAKWFGGYARNHKSGTDYAGNARKSVLLKAKMLRGLAFDLRCCDYREIAPTGATVYFDPPYFGRSSYAIHGRSSDAPSSQAGSVYGLGGFCHASFWAHARDLVRKGNTVLVTEFTAPEDWVPVWSWGDTVVRHRDAAEQRGSVEERIFTHRDQAIHDLL